MGKEVTYDVAAMTRREHLRLEGGDILIIDQRVVQFWRSGQSDTISATQKSARRVKLFEHCYSERDQRDQQRSSGKAVR
jgi:hypothetical protein